jgi:hypothetical protein
VAIFQKVILCDFLSGRLPLAAMAAISPTGTAAPSRSPELLPVLVHDRDSRF